MGAVRARVARPADDRDLVLVIQLLDRSHGRMQTIPLFDEKRLIGLLLAMALLAMLGPSIRNVIIAIAVGSMPNMARVVRSSVLSLRDQAFVEAARAVGSPTWRILLVHVTPNTLAPVTVQATFLIAAAILTEAGLSFIGAGIAGIPPFIPSWGNIISDGRNFLQIAFWIVVFPGTFLALTVLAVNLVGDGLRDAADPKLRRLG